MRLARFAPLALAALPVAAASQGSEDRPALEPQRPSEPRAGQYRTVLELIAFEVPGTSEGRARAMRDDFAAELASGNNFCLAADPADEAMSRAMLEQVAEGDCTIDSFYRTGAAINATMSCTHDASIASEVTLGGRIWTENADLDMILEQDLPGAGTTRIRVRAQSARVGDC